MDKERIKALLAAHMPSFHMHHQDYFLPCSVEWFLERSQLMLDVDAVRSCPMEAKTEISFLIARQIANMQDENGEPQSRRVLLPKGKCTAADIAAAQHARENGGLHLELDPACRCGPSPVPNYVTLLRKYRFPRAAGPGYFQGCRKLSLK